MVSSVNRKSLLFLSVLMFLATGCMRWDYDSTQEEFDINQKGLFIVCEGNFQYGNASLSFYDPQDNQCLNEVFYQANSMKLGDVAQSMTVFDGKGWIVVNNSHVVFAIDLNSFKEVGRIVNLPSPRYLHFVDNRKAYVSQLWDNRIIIVDPQKFEITGYITVPDMSLQSGSTEQMVQVGKYVYCSCWSYQNKIIKIDTEIDEVVGQLIVGIQPKSLVADKNNRLWTITDGGYEGSPYGYEAPALISIDVERFEVDAIFPFSKGDTPRDLKLNGEGDTLYWINDAVWRMDITSSRLPVSPFIESRDTKYYALSVNPSDGDVYVADAIDYQQSGIVYRFSSHGLLIDEFYVGVTPSDFCWK